MRKNLISVPEFDQLPAPVYFRYAEIDAHSHACPHRHAWGSLDYVAHGVMRFEVDGQRFMSPPQYALWIPPNTEHSAYNAQAIVYRSVYLDAAHCQHLPPRPVTLAISDILKAILSDFARRDVNIPEGEADQRLAQVLVDQLSQAAVHRCFLPYANHPGLQGVLAALQRQPGDNRPLGQWAEQAHVSERTLARLFVRELGSGASACVFWQPSKRWSRRRAACKTLVSTWVTARRRRLLRCFSVWPVARPSSIGARRGMFKRS